MIEKFQTLLSEVINPESSSNIALDEIQSEYPFTPKSININGHKYSYIDEGKGNPILMVHGNFTWSFFYRRLIKAFSKKYRVIAPDNIGCGLSDKPQNYEYHLENHIDNLETLILRLNLQRITLVVHDWGGPIGLGCAIRHQHRFVRFIILNTAAYIPEKVPWFFHFLRVPILSEFLIRNANIDTGGYGGFSSRQFLAPEVVQGMRLPYNSYENRIAIHRFIADIPLSPEDFSFEIMLQIECGLWIFRDRPIAIIWGMQDKNFAPESNLLRWRSTYPQAKFQEIDYAGHYLLEDAPVTIARYIQAFLIETDLFED